MFSYIGRYKTITYIGQYKNIYSAEFCDVELVKDECSLFQKSPFQRFFSFLKIENLGVFGKNMNKWGKRDPLAGVVKRSHKYYNPSRLNLSFYFW